MRLSLHHIKYKEIDGIDEVEIIPLKEHSAKHKVKDKVSGRFIEHGALDLRILSHAYARALRKLHIKFYIRLGESARLCEDILYNPATGNVICSAYFMGHGNKYGSWK